MLDSGAVGGKAFNIRAFRVTKKGARGTRATNFKGLSAYYYLACVFDLNEGVDGISTHNSKFTTVDEHPLVVDLEESMNFRVMGSPHQ